MAETGWRLVRIEDVGGAFAPDDGITPEEREAARTRIRHRPPEQTARNEWAEREFPNFGARWHALRQHLGISAFGINANEGDAGDLLIIPHDEVEHGQEEVYVVLRGRARIEVDGETQFAAAGDLFYARPGVLRGVFAEEDGTLLLMIGGLPGTYEPPIWARDWRPPEA